MMYRKLLASFITSVVIFQFVFIRESVFQPNIIATNSQGVNVISSGSSWNGRVVMTIDVDTACPRSLEINAVNDQLPPSHLMNLEDVRSTVGYWHKFNCPRKLSCRFASIGQHLLHSATKQNRTLFTVQVGAMDGKSNDPMYGMFVDEKQKYVGGRESFSGDLKHWLPVLVEPVPTNFEAMTKTYTNIAKTKGLGCAVPIHAAVSYDDPTKTSCPFCRVNTSPDAPEICKKMPDWKRLQIGTLDCEHSKRYFKDKFDECVLQDPLPCSSIVRLLEERSLSSQYIAMLQVDIEGYEYILLGGLFKEVPDHLLPPVIHFEHKVMKDQDIKNPLTGKNRVDFTKNLLESKGYLLYDQGEDYLAVRVDSSVSSAAPL